MLRADHTSCIDSRPLGGPCESSHIVDGFLDALTRWRARAPSSSGGGEAVVFVERERGRVEIGAVVAIPKDAPCALVAGAHPCVDVVLGGDASLRHVAILCWPSVDGRAPEIEVLDLRTSTGIGRGGHTVSALTAFGALQCTVGLTRITVVALAPHEPGPRYPDELDDRLARASVVELRGLHDQRRDLGVRRQAISRVLDTAGRRAAGESSAITFVDEAVRRALLRVPSTRDAHTLFVPASASDLANGVVLGRDARCVGWSSLNDRCISRVHAMVVARRGRLFVVDLGSTNGTDVYDERTGADRAFLSEEKRVHALAPSDGISLHGHPVVVLLAS